MDFEDIFDKGAPVTGIVVSLMEEFIEDIFEPDTDPNLRLDIFSRVIKALGEFALIPILVTPMALEMLVLYIVWQVKGMRESQKGQV